MIRNWIIKRAAKKHLKRHSVLYATYGLSKMVNATHELLTVVGREALSEYDCYRRMMKLIK